MLHAGSSAGGAWQSQHCCVSYFRRVLDNLEVNISNIHVRFEDLDGLADPVAVGVMIDGLRLV